MSAAATAVLIRTMFVTDTNRTFIWYPSSFQGQRQLVDITDRIWHIVSDDCGSYCEVVNTLKANGHTIVDQLELDAT